MTPACPTCRAPWRETTECPRCGSDLAPLMRAAVTAWSHRRAAVAALLAGEYENALAHAAAATALQRTADAVDVAFVARLLLAGV